MEKNNNNDELNIKFKNKISNRNNILKWVLLFVIIIFVFAILLFNKTIVDLTSFDFSDMLAIIVSLYAMYISVKFYQITEKSSATFYGQVYNFINDISKSIEGLNQSVNEKLSGIKQTVDFGFGFNGSSEDNQKAKKDLENDIKELQEQINIYENEKDDLLNKLSEEKGQTRELRKKLEIIDENLFEKKIESRIINEEIKERKKMDKLYYFYNLLCSRLPLDGLKETLSRHEPTSARRLYKYIRAHFSDEEFDKFVKDGFILENRNILDKSTHKELVELYNI